MRNDFILLVLSYNHPTNVLSLETLKKTNYDGNWALVVGEDDPQLENYKKLYPDGYQYTQFKHYFKQWLDENHLESNLRMAINRVPGEIMYIDWAGDTLDLVYTDVPDELQTAHFFTTTLGVSSCCFIMAFPNEQTPNFLQGTIEALNFYGGVPKILKPDNTKAASIKNTKDVLILKIWKN